MNFTKLLKEAVHSSFKSQVYGTHENWKEKLAQSEVRLQWDPDHNPNGGKLDRRAIQIGIKGSLLAKFAKEWIVSIEDITPFVHEQKKILDANDFTNLKVIKEKVIQIEDEAIITKL